MSDLKYLVKDKLTFVSDANAGLKVESNKIKHSNSITSDGLDLKRITYDAQGHITSYKNVGYGQYVSCSYNEMYGFNVSSINCVRIWDKIFYLQIRFRNNTGSVISSSTTSMVLTNFKIDGNTVKNSALTAVYEYYTAPSTMYIVNNNMYIRSPLKDLVNGHYLAGSGVLMSN